MPRVSVVIPTFNRQDYVQIAIQSVLQQTYRDIEIIVCDDGSTDNTVEVVKSIQASSELPIRLEILPFNLGVSAARNRSVFIASGEFIAFLDSDDSWKPEKLEKQVAFLDNNRDFIGVGCNSFIIKEGNKIERNPDDFNIFNPDNELFQMLYKCYITTSCFLVKKDALILAGLFDLTLQKGQDRDLWWRLPRLGRIGFIDEPLVNYIEHGLRISSTMSKFTEKTYIPVIKKTVWFYRDKLNEKQKNKIISNAHLLVSYDAFAAENFLLCAKHSLIAILYRNHFSQAMKLIISSFLKFFSEFFTCRMAI